MSADSGHRILLHQGSPAELINLLIGSGTEPVTLICPRLPHTEILDQLVVVTSQKDRVLRIVTTLFCQNPSSTRQQIESLLRLDKVGARIKTADRGSLPSMLLSPPEGSALLPAEWGHWETKWFRPVIIQFEAHDFFNLGDRIWRQARSNLSPRRLKLSLKWLEDIEEEYMEPEERVRDKENGVKLSELTLFDKPRGRRSQRVAKDNNAWWTFHGTSEDRVNPFLPVSVWASQKNAHKCIRFPMGKRPTGIKTGDMVFFVLLSRQPGGDPDLYIIGRAKALAYRPLLDDASNDEKEANEYLAHYPHSLRITNVQFINGLVGEGVSALQLMNQLGSQIFESTMRNRERERGNLDPRKSIAQKSLILLSSLGANESLSSLEDCMRRLGMISGWEING